MQAEFDRRWNKPAQEVLSRMRDWRVQHPTATITEIEEELDTRMARLRAGLLEDLAMASAAAEVGGSQAKERPKCSTFFTGVQVAEATVRQVREQAGAAQVYLQENQVTRLLSERPPTPAGPTVQLLSLDGCYIQMVGGEWREVKTLALGEVEEPVEEQGEQVVQSRMKGAGMRWEPAHVDAVLALRNMACNDRWEAGWVAIGQRWQQDRQSKRAVRAQPASPQVEPAHTTPAQREPIPACTQGNRHEKGSRPHTRLLQTRHCSSQHRRNRLVLQQRIRGASPFSAVVQLNGFTLVPTQKSHAHPKQSPPLFRRRKSAMVN